MWEGSVLIFSARFLTIEVYLDVKLSVFKKQWSVYSTINPVCGFTDTVSLV